MDWLNTWTAKLKLRNSFACYLLLSMISGLISGFLARVLLETVKYQHLVKSSQMPLNTNLWTQFILSKKFVLLMDLIFPVIFFVFILLGFSLFYKHKIRSSISAIDQNKIQEEFISANQGEFISANQDELATACNSALTRIEELEQQQLVNSLYLNDFSRKTDTLLHEIKNPLATIKGDVQLLNMLVPNQNSQTKEIISRLERNEKRIESYLNKLTEKNIEHLELKIKETLVEHFWETICRKFANNRIPIIFENNLKNSDLLIKIDESSFGEALTNIIDNSNRYAKKQIIISISEHCTGNNNSDHILLTIADDGVGFSQDAIRNYAKPYFSENRQQVFSKSTHQDFSENMQQEFTETVQPGNMGLGLFIAKTLFEKQNISVQIKNSRGAVTELKIPVYSK